MRAFGEVQDADYAQLRRWIFSERRRSTGISGIDPFLPVANGSYQEANHGTRFRYSGRFILRSNAL